MQSLKFIAAIIAVLTLNSISEVQASCSLTLNMVLQESRIFFQNDDREYGLMFKDNVNWGSNVFLICTPQDIVTIHCGFWGSFDREPPIGNCPRPIRPRVEFVSDTSCSASMYTVGYARQLVPGSRKVEYYRSCYNVPLMNAQFVVHRVYPYSFTAGRPDIGWTTDNVITGAEAESFKPANVYARFKLLLGVNQHYVTNAADIVINRGHLAPSADFLFKQARIATFKYVNAVPQFATINQGNWKTIEEWVRNHVKDNGRAFIVTGSIGVLRLCNTNGKYVPIYLEAPDRNPIPKWIYKLVDSAAIRTVFVTLNNRWAFIAPRAICLTHTCPMQLIASGRKGYTFCCDVDDFQHKYLPNLAVPYYDTDDSDEL